MNNEYKIIPFAEVKIGQEFEDGGVCEFGNLCWVKMDEKHYTLDTDKKDFRPAWFNIERELFPDGCLVRIADCEPELDTCTWTYKEYAWESACGAEFVFTEEQDSLELNSFKFCHKCGEKIVEAK